MDRRCLTKQSAGPDVCNIENSYYIKVKGVDFSTGAASINETVASASIAAEILIEGHYKMKSNIGLKGQIRYLHRYNIKIKES